MANLENTDLLLVNKAGTSYTITGQEFKESVLDDLVVQVLLDPSTPVINNDLNAIPTAVGGKSPDGGYSYSYQWTIADDVTGTNATISNITLSFIYLTSDLLGKFIKCDVTTTDAIGTTATGSTGYTEIEKIVIQEAPLISSVELTQDQTNSNRFTGNSFTSTVNSFEVLPNPTTSIRAEVSGDLAVVTGTDLITANNYTGTSIPLTLNSDTNLTNNAFEAGDVVKANESYTPQSSEIESISQSFTIFGSVVKNNVVGYSGDFATDFFTFLDGTASQANFSYSQTGIPYGFSFDVSETPIYADSIVFDMNGNNSDANGVAVYVDTVNVGTYPQSAPQSIVEFTINTSFTNIEIRTNDVASGSNDYISPKRIGYKKDGVTTWITASPGEPFNTILKLTDDTDIKLFQADDVVQPGDGMLVTGGVYSTSTLYSGSYNPTDAIFHDSDPNTGIGTEAVPNNFVTNDLREIKSLAKVVVGYGADGVADTGWNNFYIEGTKVQVSTDNTTWVNKGTCIKTNDDQTFECTGNYRYVRLFQPADKHLAVGTFKVYEVDPNNAPKVVSTDVTAKTITVDNGNWDSSNQSQVWSNGSSYTGSANSYATLTGGGFTGKSGDLNTNGVTTDDLWGCSAGTAIWTGSVSYTESVAMWAYTNSSATWKFTIDGVEYDVTSQIPSAPGGNPGSLTTFTGLPVSGTITKFELVATNDVQGKGFTGWYIDGQLLVDAAVDSQVWTDTVTTTGTFASSGPLSLVFDGKLNTNTFPNVGNATTITFPSTLTGTKVEFLVSVSLTADGFEVNGQDASSSYTGVSDGVAVWCDVSSYCVAAGGLDSFSMVYTDLVALQYIHAIKIDDKLVIDKGVRNLGYNKVTSVFSKRGKGTISDVTGSVVTIDPFTDCCFKEGQYLIHDTPKSILITPKTDNITNINNNTLTFSGNKDLLNFAAGDPVTMVDSLGNTATYTANTTPITNVEDVPLQTPTLSISGWSVNPGYVADGNTGNVSPNSTGQGAGTFSFNPPLAGVRKIRAWTRMYGTSWSKIYDENDNLIEEKNYDGGNPLKWIEIYEGDPITLSKYEQLTHIGSGSGSDDFGGLEINGQVIQISGGNSNTTTGTIVGFDNGNKKLTFTNNQNLQYYSVGEIVQDGPAPRYYTVESGNTKGSPYWNLDGQVTERIRVSTRMRINPPIPATGSVRFYNSEDPWGVWYVIDDEGNQYSATQSGSGTAFPTINLTGSKNIAIIGMNANSGQGANMRTVEINGQILVLPKSVQEGGTLPAQEFYKVSEINDDPADAWMTVTGGTWSNGETINKLMSGTGTVVSTDAANNTMTINNNNGEWLAGYFAQTPQRPALSKTGYLKIDIDGTVTGVSHLPQPDEGSLLSNPVLTFPDTFDTGNAPDVELPYPTGLKTTITQTNFMGSSSVSSNQVFPETTGSTYTPAANSLDFTTEGYAEFVAKVSSFEGRAAAQRAINYNVDSAALETATENEADTYVANNNPFQTPTPTTTTVAVTVAGGYYYIDGVQQDSITMNVGDTIVFDQSDSSNSGHPLAIYTTADKQAPAPGNINPSGSNVAYTPDTAGTYYYQCASHSNMGGSITVS